jgi:hypothetical protein
MSLLDDFARVSKRRPCPVCGRSGWCLVARDSLEDPSRAVCARVESNKRWGHAGWLHVLRDNGRLPHGLSLRTISIASPDDGQEWARVTARYREEVGRGT